MEILMILSPLVLLLIFGRKPGMSPRDVKKDTVKEMKEYECVIVKQVVEDLDETVNELPFTKRVIKRLYNE